MIRIALAGLGLFLVATPALAGGVQAETPTQAVLPFYDHIGLELDPSARGRFADPAKTVLDDNDRLRKSGEGNCLDPNLPLDNVEAGAGGIRKALRTAEAVNGDQANVIVAFAVKNEPHRLEWKLKRIDGAWKIVDLVSATGEWALSQYHCE